MAILSCHVSIKLPPKISDGQESCIRRAVNEHGLKSDLGGPADASSEDEAATGTAFALM